ncbi:MAG: hypothetical protein LBC46_00930 [Treponema sp.]|jgi:hypothetical protein|nr:hypothetical protein [Treponema sp.]
MVQNADVYSLYSILTGYAQKKHSPLIEVNEFLDFLERYVKHHASEHQEWKNWSIGTRPKFWEELKQLTEAGTCIIQEKGKSRYLYLPKHCITLIDNAYHANFKPSEDGMIPPFPSELSLKISLPPEAFIFIEVNDLASQLEDLPPQDAFISMSFPNPLLGSILLLGSTIANDFLEAAFVRVRYHLLKELNHDFFQKKLSHYFHDREEYPRDMLNKLIQKPGEVADNLLEGEESSYLLWLSFCGEVKNDLQNKKILSPDESTVLQAAYIIEQYNAFYNKIARKRKDKEEAFKELLVLLGRTPYLFKAGQIANFIGSDGRPLLIKHYTHQELSDYFDEIGTAKEDKAPLLITLTDQKNNERWYILKQKLPLLCVRYLLDARPILKNAIVDHWEDVLLEYETEESMTNPSVFEIVLWRYLYSLIPPLAAMLEYKQISQLYMEIDNSWEGYSEFIKLFDRDTGKLYSLSTLLFLNQKNLLSEARERLPFLYMFPFIGAIIIFFRKQKQKKKAGSGQQSIPTHPAASKEIPVTKEVPVTLKLVCSKLEAALVPEGYTLEWYLIRLYEKWAKLFKNKDEKMDEMNRLIRNRLRRNAPLYKLSQINEDFLNEIADGLIENTPSLKHMDQDSLKLYIKLYTLKLLRTMRHSGFRV